jgi:hypothetical protein
MVMLAVESTEEPFAKDTNKSITLHYSIASLLQ